MREIKFRAWDDNGKYFKPLDDDGDYYFRDDSDGLTLYDKWGECKNVTLLQFTGLKDKNGIDIYEGDIIKVTHEQFDWQHTGAVVYGDTGRFYVDADGYVPSLVHPGHVYEIIGNIYQSSITPNPQDNKK